MENFVVVLQLYYKFPLPALSSILVSDSAGRAILVRMLFFFQELSFLVSSKAVFRSFFSDHRLSLKRFRVASLSGVFS